ncbi:transcriptional regulator, LysR family [Kribbella flavida DSM 17836]|uniref:Transcriptional regulator, LysR family n=1 Tax=Kribbella flavida (strain DSM 17836 / JCM 10339 / NBRC 14399) TaxID=479435 RepID=D2PTM8_KRIFD|nr:LysR substrate-binding domain-containing protein [Kribbella flavida]ADB31341.1 transcriptional regulator, LysR family [Kribbella flavida DSM 17836]
MEPLRPDFIDDLRRLRVLREFRERGTVTATAAALHLTPSAVSQQLAGLAHDVGFPLTRRDGRRIVLTARGQTLLAHADAVFARLEQARHDLQTFDETLRGELTIGAFSSALAGLLPGVLASLRADFPQLQVSLRQLEPPGLFDLLDTGRVDIALAVSFDGSPATRDPRYHRVELGADVLDVALPAGHPLAAEAAIDLRALDDDLWITGTPEGCCAVITSTACAAAGFAPRVAHRVDDWLAVTQLVAQGHAVALVPRLAQRDLPAGLTIRPVLGASPQRHLFAAIREGAQNSPLLATALTHLRRAAT